MSHETSRKRFIAKLVGMAAVAGLAPRLLAKSAPAAMPSTAAGQESKTINLRPETRAVSRHADSV